MIAWALIAVSVLVIFASVVTAKRGRRIGDDPTCRACGYDLSGQWPLEFKCTQCGKRLAPTCPECAADLTRRRSVRRGSKRGRPVLTGAGIALGVLGLAIGSLMLWTSMTRYNWNGIKPGVWLVTEARAGDAGALEELITRFEAGQLGQAHAVVLVDKALEAQINTDGAWLERWGDLFAAALNRGFVTQGQLDEFTSNLYDIRLLHQSKIRRGQPWNAGWNIQSLRLPPGRWLAIEDLQHFSVGDQVLWDRPQDPNLLNRAAQRTARADARWHPRTVPRLRPLTLEPGVYPVRATFSVGFRDSVATPPKDTVRSVTIESEIEILGSDVEPGVEQVADEAARRAIMRVMSVKYLRMVRDTPQGAMTWTDVHVREPPMNLGFDVIVRSDQTEWPVGQIVVHKGEYENPPFGGQLLPLDGFTRDLTQIDLILRSSPEAWEALGLTDTDGIWDGEIILEDLPVQWDQ